MTTVRTLLVLPPILMLSVALSFAAPPPGGVSESASGFPSGTEKTQVPPAPAGPTATPAAPAAAPAGPSSSTAPAASLPASSAPAATAAPADSISLSNNDLNKPVLLGPGPTPLPSEPVALAVDVDGQTIPPDGFCVLVDSRQEIAFEPRTPPNSTTLKFQGPATMDLEKSRQYEIAETLSTIWRMDGGALLRQEAGKTFWRAPAAADACRVEIVLDRQSRFEDLSDTALQSDIQARGVGGKWSATFLVRVPYDPKGDGIVDGYTVGIYPNATLDTAPPPVRAHPDAYAAPKSLIPVTPETAGLRVSPHFRLGDFSPRSEEGKRHFIALDARLPTFLEGLSAKLDSASLNGSAIRILQAYVSPYQRQVLAREGVPLVEFTRYQYGDSATIIVDADRNGVMDDLNGDGAMDVKDADRLAELMDAVQQELKIYGGIGTYARFEGVKGPETSCVQVDLRGWRQRWRRGEE